MPPTRGRHAPRRRHRWFRSVAVASCLVVVAGTAFAVHEDLFYRTWHHLFHRSVGSVHFFGLARPLPSNPAPTPGPINTSFPGITTFRGNASRDYYGEGPIPAHPAILWTYPRTGGLCMRSSDDGITYQGASSVWCGDGWTGQPNVIQHPNGTVEVRVGAYDGHYHFLDGATGQPLRPDLVTGDLTKGSATSDSDGYPLYYAGSRDNFFRIIATDRSKPTVLWQLNTMTSVPRPIWNNDMDGASLQIGDYLLEGMENSWFYVIRLNRHYNAQHLVEVSPKIVMAVPGFDHRLLSDLGDYNVSIEDSVAFRNGIAYFSNSGGLVQGWDIRDILKGGTHYRRVFRFWDGDENDASIVIDPQGDLYVSRHASFDAPTRSQARDHELGDLVKLDPRKPKDPIVWSVQLGSFEQSIEGGLLGTPALYHGVVYATYDDGGFAAIDAATGKVLWNIKLGSFTWMSPVALDDQLLIGDCSGVLHDYDISHPTQPPKELWNIQLNGCVEATPAVWHGMIYTESRGGQIYGIGEARNR